MSFAKSGDPNRTGLPVWLAFDASSQRVMYLDADLRTGPVPNLQQLDVLDHYFAHLRAEAHARVGGGN